MSSGIKLNFLDPTPSSSLCPWHLFRTLCLMHLRGLVLLLALSYLQCGAKKYFISKFSRLVAGEWLQQKLKYLVIKDLYLHGCLI